MSKVRVEDHASAGHAGGACTRFKGSESLNALSLLLTTSRQTPAGAFIDRPQLDDQIDQRCIAKARDDVPGSRGNAHDIPGGKRLLTRLHERCGTPFPRRVLGKAFELSTGTRDADAALHEQQVIPRAVHLDLTRTSTTIQDVLSISVITQPKCSPVGIVERGLLGRAGDIDRADLVHALCLRTPSCEGKQRTTSGTQPAALPSCR